MHLFEDNKLRAEALRFQQLLLDLPYGRFLRVRLDSGRGYGNYVNVFIDDERKVLKNTVHVGIEEQGGSIMYHYNYVTYKRDDLIRFINRDLPYIITNELPAGKFREARNRSDLLLYDDELYEIDADNVGPDQVKEGDVLISIADDSGAYDWRFVFIGTVNEAPTEKQNLRLVNSYDGEVKVFWYRKAKTPGWVACELVNGGWARIPSKKTNSMIKLKLA